MAGKMPTPQYWIIYFLEFPYTNSINDCNTSLGKDAMNRDAMNRDAMNRDAMNRDAMNGLFVAFFFSIGIISLIFLISLISWK
ncbi:hypothetical protein LC613_20945 [Nostoc sphaeroides CHAB 2801]|uniref:hypothetical protein n=1 Tax=Nostoc sphaeroides TaxID=446679 RepID=UPI000E497C79|nr:hypothetical protein [Nostoc sphaeroides]MCC5630342.1 hypothetical protein [Nostoc sphaeroides CHAB 2801]